MEKTGNRGGLKLVLGIIILVVAIIALVVALSSCSGDDADKDVAENNPPVVDNADDGEDADNGEDKAPAGNGGSGSRPTGGSNAPTGGSTPPAGDNAGTETGSNASLQEWIEYIRHYDDNVENGVESATKDFTDMIDQVGNQMAGGNYQDGFDQFGSGLKDYAGGIIGSLTP